MFKKDPLRAYSEFHSKFYRIKKKFVWCSEQTSAPLYSGIGSTNFLIWNYNAIFLFSIPLKRTALYFRIQLVEDLENNTPSYTTYSFVTKLISITHIYVEYFWYICFSRSLTMTKENLPLCCTYIFKLL